MELDEKTMYVWVWWRSKYVFSSSQIIESKIKMWDKCIWNIDGTLMVINDYYLEFF